MLRQQVCTSFSDKFNLAGEQFIRTNSIVSIGCSEMFLPQSSSLDADCAAEVRTCETVMELRTSSLSLGLNVGKFQGGWRGMSVTLPL